MRRLVLALLGATAAAACAASRPPPLTLTAGAVRARFDERCASLEIDGRRVEVHASSLGRLERAPLARVAPSRVGGYEVQYARAAGVTEWWRALPAGLEHGVTIDSRPPGDGPLVLTVAIGGELSAQDRAGGIALVDRRGLQIGRYDELVVLDASAARIPARMRAALGDVVIEIDDAGARYPLVVDPFVGAAEASFSGSVFHVEFGSSVSMTHDGSRIVIGDPETTPSGGSGSAHFYVRSGTSWTREVVLRAPGMPAGVQFGAAVAISGDGLRAVVGAPAELLAGSARGTARVYLRAASGWSPEATLTLPTSGSIAYTGFGSAVALSDDGALALVGAAHGEAAYVFARAGTNWSLEATLLNAAGASGDLFGRELALAGDGTRALVGAPHDEDAAGAYAGSAHFFARSGTTWTLEHSVVGAAALGFVGASVAMSQDGSRALIGATSGPNRVYVRSGSSWSEEATLTTTASFGASLLAVALSADGTRALVGITDGGPTGGDVLEFARTSTAWSSPTTVNGAATRFGEALSMAADGSRAVIGSPESPGPGRAYVYADLGAPCAGAADCPSGFCVDGVCCDTACGGGATDDCRACATGITGAPSGRCAPLSAALAPTVTCRLPAGPCDASESCRSTSTECPPDGFRGGVCRAARGPCDTPESCTGSNAACPADVQRPAGYECLPSAGACDSAEVCDGVSDACPANALAAAGTECRAATGACDVAEVCDGASAVCPAGVRAPAGTECRTASGPCDVAEACDGASDACPTDALVPAGFECRPATGPCDAPEACDGASDACPSDVLAPAGIECRPAAGACDLAEACDGLGASCPADVFAPSGSVCRASTDSACDPAEVCDGAAIECPADVMTCGDDAGVPLDAGAIVDAGVPDDAEISAPDGGGPRDAGGLSETAPGCACRAGARAGGSPLFALLVAALVSYRTRRRSRD